MERRKKNIQLLKMLNEWDPLGVMSDGVTDEYTCFIPPIIDALKKGSNKKDLVDIVNIHIKEHLGIETKNYKTIEFVDKVLNWWKNLT